ncbi:MBL fold metallo-hydrolase [Aureimonas altamirensis]|uniref:MBL fold metallo-hydrolase n=1 Tax=Aureimonas altamirensis TaxID=370622 RepID=UPI00203672E4|nr:MBL fold metallo-hydrolase [Aureimonas altamirensis]
MTNDNLTMNRRQTLALLGGGALLSTTGALLMTDKMAAAATTQATLTQIRNATLRVDYGGVRFLVDPMLARVGAYAGFEGSAMSHLRNPLVPLPVPVEELTEVDAVLVTHLHSDHWDEVAIATLNKALPIFSQNEEDAGEIRKAGFTDVRVLTEQMEFNGVLLSKTEGLHGTEATLNVLPLGHVCGIVFSHPDHKTLYVAGDTIWNEDVETALKRHKPDVIVLNTGMATFIGLDPIIMGEKDVLSVHRASPNAMLVASHMEAVNHCILSRADLRAFAEKEGFSEKLLIPADGEALRI